MSVEFGISSNVKFLTVEKAKEWESYRNLPKFTHVPMAVIHPSPRKKIRPELSPTPNLTISGNNAKLLSKRYEVKQLPDHLIRAPMETTYSTSSPKRVKSVGGFGSSSGNKKSLKQVKNAKEASKKQESESKRSKKAEENKKVIFAEVKKIIDSKSDDEQFLQPFIPSFIRDAKNALRDKKIFRHLYAAYTNQRYNEPRVSKNEFTPFIKTLCKVLGDNDINDLFLSFCKRLDAQLTSPTKDENNDTFKNSIKNSKNLNGKNQRPQTANFKKEESSPNQVDLKDLKLDLAIIDNAFEKWFKEEESLSGVLNMKLIKQKNTDFRVKLDVWNKRLDERKRQQRRVFEHGKKIRVAFEKYQDDFNIEKDKVITCVIDYNQFCEMKDRAEKEEKIINNFMCQLPESSQILEIKDLERILDNETKQNKMEINLLRDFAQIIRTECVLNSYYFSFFDIPDLIVKKKYQRKDYDQIIHLLQKVKKAYLGQKSLIVKDRPLDQIEITDEDLVPLELFDQVIAQQENKCEEKKQYLVSLIQKAKYEAASKIKQLGVDTEKTKKIVENSTFITFLNQLLELTHQQIFTFNYKHQLIYLHFVVQQQYFKAAREFEHQYLECLKVERSDNKFNKEWRDRMNREMMKFNGKIAAIGDENSISDATSDDKKSQRIANQNLRPKSALKSNASASQHQQSQQNLRFMDQQQKQLHAPPRPSSNLNTRDDEVDDVIAKLNPNVQRGRRDSTDALNDRDDQFDAMNFKKFHESSSGDLKGMNEYTGLIQPIAVDPMRELGKGLGQYPEDATNAFIDEEEQAEEQRRQEEAKKKSQESPYKEYYKDGQGNAFDPNKKFGIIQDNSLIYDNITSSYPLNLPTDYYQRYIQGTLPQKDAGKWFIRPHHLETLTEHPQSVKDDVLNTRYYSHYNQKHGKKEEKNEAEEAIKTIEKHLSYLKSQNYMLSMQKGNYAQEEERIEELRERMKRQAQDEYEKFIHDKTRSDSKSLIVEAYEGVLYEKRRLEKELLNGKRFKEFEKNRPPQDKWYELKSTEFSKELYRNRMALKPNDANRVYLQTLQDTLLY